MKLCALPYGFDHILHLEEKTSRGEEVVHMKVADDDDGKMSILRIGVMSLMTVYR